MQYRILGVLRVLGTQRGDDGPGQAFDLGGPRQQLVLAVLLLHANRAVLMEELIDAVWGAHPPRSARKTAQVYVSRLRMVLGNDAVVSAPDGYRLVVEPGVVDADVFTDLVAQAEEARGHDPERARRLLDRALALWRGSPWGALADEPALVADANRLREQRLDALEFRHELALSTGHDRGLVADLEVLAGRHPLRERLRGLLMLALYRGGRQADALLVYEDLRTVLAEELGTDPGPASQDLHRRILQQDPALLGTHDRGPVAEAASRNPYKGLRPFGRADAGDFFGRINLTAHLVTHVADHPFTAVVGPSGSGKSSVVQAGVLPALAAGALPGAQEWLVATMMPGAHPFRELHAALARARDRHRDGLADAFRGDDLDLVRAVLHVADDTDTVVLVVDQFEELFVGGSEEVGERFVRNLAEAAEDPHSRLRTIVTVRADFLDWPLSDPRLGPWVDRGMVSVLPLTPVELEEACVSPAAGVGVGVEPELIAQVVADVARRPGALPLFQYALTEVFANRGDGPLTLAVHDRLGGMHGVLARRAEQVWGELEPAATASARDLFLRLVTPGDGADDTRRRVLRRELDASGDAASVEALLDAFGAARLLTFDRDASSGAATVELAHEAMLEAWPRLRAWIDDARADLLQHQQVAAAAREWDASTRDPGLLLSGTRLDLALRLADEGAVAMNSLEREFVVASRGDRDEQQRIDEERRRHEALLERRARQRLRLAVVILAVATLVGAGLTGWAVDRGNRAEDARIDAVVANEITRVGQLTAAALNAAERDSQLSLLLALHAIDISHAVDQPVPAETVIALHLGLQAMGATYPFREAPTIVVDGPSGPRGIFDLPLPELIDLARNHLERAMTQAECSSWLGVSACPQLPLAAPDDLAWEDPTPTGGTSGPLGGTTVRLINTGLVEPFRVLPDVQEYATATGITIDVDVEFDPRARMALGWVDLELPAPVEVVGRGRAGELIDLSTWFDRDSLDDELSAYMVALGADGADGPLWGLPWGLLSKSGIWYPPRAFAEAGYEVPTSWDELVALGDRIVADGRTPWCLAEAFGNVAGWPSTDWIEDLVLHEFGVDVYDGWVAHDIPFDDPRIRRAFERYAELLLGPGRIHNGPRAATTTQLDEGWRALTTDPPGCWMMHLPSFATQWFGDLGVRPGEDLAVFSMPAISPAGDGTHLGAGGYISAFSDRPEVREAVRWVTGPDFGRRMFGDVEWGNWLFSAHPEFPLDAYQDPAQRAMAAEVRDAVARDRFRFDGSDLMPIEVSSAFWEAMIMYVQDGPDNLDTVLAHMEEAWAKDEAGG